jgi:hypothetical protein
VKQLQEEMGELKKQLEGQVKSGDNDQCKEEYEKVSIVYCSHGLP